MALALDRAVSIAPFLTLSIALCRSLSSSLSVCTYVQYVLSIFSILSAVQCGGYSGNRVGGTIIGAEAEQARAVQDQ